MSTIEGLLNFFKKKFMNCKIIIIEKLTNITISSIFYEGVCANNPTKGDWVSFPL